MWFIGADALSKSATGCIALDPAGDGPNFERLCAFPVSGHPTRHKGRDVDGTLLLKQVIKEVALPPMPINPMQRQPN